jgi:hypothetical protein
LPTANKWARFFIPAALSADGEDKLLTAEDIKKLSPPPPAYTGRQQEKRIALVFNGGPRPDDWTREEEQIVKERQHRRRTEELTHLWIEKKFDAPRQDYFKNILAKTKIVKQFQLKSKEQSDTQLIMFDAIDGYIKMFPDKETRLAAAANLTAQIHEVVNHLVELEIAQGGESEE